MEIILLAQVLGVLCVKGTIDKIYHVILEPIPEEKDQWSYPRCTILNPLKATYHKAHLYMCNYHSIPSNNFT
eukprot:15364682-Ditylum_brightwellii.AAC.1